MLSCKILTSSLSITPKAFASNLGCNKYHFESKYIQIFVYSSGIGFDVSSIENFSSILDFNPSTVFPFKLWTARLYAKTLSCEPGKITVKKLFYSSSPVWFGFASLQVFAALDAEAARWWPSAIYK